VCNDEADTTMHSTLSVRYARALADAVRAKSNLESIAGELERIARLFGESRPLRDFLLNPGLPAVMKSQAFETIAKELGLSAPVQRLFQILLQKGRVDLLPEISAAFRRIEEQSANRVSVEVTTAVPLGEALKKKLAGTLEEFTGKTVRLETRVDPAVLGGARTRIGSTLYDGTVAARLRRLKEQLIGER
jgi:F-type H+-transporting ATPase subunit delta